MKFSSEEAAQAAFEQWRADGEYFDFRGHRIFYRRAGSGRPLLLVHGFPTASWDWIHIWQELSAQYHLIAPDMLGFGWSAKPRNHRYTMIEQADMHEALLDHLGVGDFAILCHDYGVSVVQEILARYEARLTMGDIPRLLYGICFLNGGLFPEMHRARLVQKLLNSWLGPIISRLMGRGGFGRGFSAVFGPDTQPTPGELDRFWELVSSDNGQLNSHLLIRYMNERRENRTRWVEPLQKTRVPLRLVNGSLDPVSGRHLSDYYREIIPDPDIVDLPDVGHYPQVEDPDAVLQAALAFFHRIYPPDAAATEPGH